MDKVFYHITNIFIQKLDTILINHRIMYLNYSKLVNLLLSLRVWDMFITYLVIDGDPKLSIRSWIYTRCTKHLFIRGHSNRTWLLEQLRKYHMTLPIMWHSYDFTKRIETWSLGFSWTVPRNFLVSVQVQVFK